MTDPDYWRQIAFEQQIAELSEAEFAALVARTRPPQLPPKDQAHALVAQYLQQTDLPDSLLTAATRDDNVTENPQ